MQTEDNQLLLATGYDMGSRLRIRWLWEMEKQSDRYDNEYLAAQIASMSGGNVWVYAIYESDTIPQNILVGFLINNGGSNNKGFSVFKYDAKTDSYKTRGFSTFVDSGSDCVTIADDWGLDHSVTIILSNRGDLSYVTVGAKGEQHRESVGKISFPAMLVIEWSEILSEEQVAAMEVHYYNDRDQELNAAFIDTSK